MRSFIVWLQVKYTQMHSDTLVLDSRNSLRIALIPSQPFTGKYFTQWVQYEDINFTPEIKYTNPNRPIHTPLHIHPKHIHTVPSYQQPYTYCNQTNQAQPVTLSERCVTHFLCPLLWRKRGHFLQEIYRFSSVWGKVCVWGMYFVSSYAVGISKSSICVILHSLMPTGFLTKSIYKPTLKFNGVTGILNLPLFRTQDSKI